MENENEKIDILNEVEMFLLKLEKLKESKSE